jgi:hypothetical protein
VRLFESVLMGLDHGVGHPVLSVLFYNSLWRPEGAGGISMDARIAANIEQGFCLKKRSAAVVPSGRVRKKWWIAVRHAHFLGWSSLHS